MKFKTLMGIRNKLISEMLRIDNDIEVINDDIEEMKEEAGTCWIGDNPKYKDRYDYNRKRLADLNKQKAELQFFIDDIENAELK